MIHQKQQRKKQRDEASVPQVGIFWILPDGLRAYGVQYHEGEQYRDFIKTPDGHYETWEKLRMVSGNLQKSWEKPKNVLMEEL